MSTLIETLLWGLGAAVAFAGAAAVAEHGREHKDYLGWFIYGLGTWTVLAVLTSCAWMLGWWTP